MGIPIAAISAGVGIAKQVFGKKKRPDIRRAIAELRAARPVGYLTPEDMRAAELTRGRITQGVQAQGQLGGYEIGRRFRARGLTGSPSEERSRARLEQQTLLGVQGAGETAEEQLYSMRTGREGFERQKALDIFGAQVGESSRESARIQAEQGAFWNSLNEFVPTILGAIDKPETASSIASGTQVGPPTGPRRPSPGFEPEARPGF